MHAIVQGAMNMDELGQRLHCNDPEELRQALNEALEEQTGELLMRQDLRVAGGAARLKLHFGRVRRPTR